MDNRRAVALRKTVSCLTRPVVTTDSAVDSTSDSGSEQLTINRSVSDIERSSSIDRRVRRVGMDSVDSSSELLDFLNAADSATGGGEFVRSFSQRGRRPSRLAVDSRERVTPPLSSAAATPDTSDSDDLPPPLFRGGPGRWSLRDRTTPGRRTSPLLWTARTPEDSDSRSTRRSISDDGVECLLDLPENSLEQRRRARQQQTPSPVTARSAADDRVRGSRWSPNTADVFESSASAGNSLRPDDAKSSRRQCSTTDDVDRAIEQVEETGKQIDKIVAGCAALTAKTQEAKHVVTPDSETRRHGRIFEDDIDDDDCVHLQRRATLPRRWRYENRRRLQTSNVDEYMEGIPECPPGRTGLGLQQGYSHEATDLACKRVGSETADSQSSVRTGGSVDSSLDAAQSMTLMTRRTLPEIPEVSRAPSLASDKHQDLERPSQPDSPPTPTAESRPASVDIDSISTSSSSRDEGFESAVDNGGQSARSSALCYPDFDLPADQTLSSQQDRIDSRLRMMKSETTSPSDADDSVSAGTMFFARSNDSLVMPKELVLSGETIDVDHFDADQVNNITNSTTEIARSTDQPSSSGPKASGSAPKSGGSKSSLLTNLTARLTRPKKSSVGATKATNADAKQPAAYSAAAARSAKSSAFDRGSVLRATMPTTLRTKKSASSTANGRDPLAPEPPQRTTSIRDGIQTPHRQSPATARQQRTTATSRSDPASSVSRKSQGDVAAKQPVQQSTARGRAPASDPSKDRETARSDGRDKLVLYKVVPTTKSPAARTTSNTTTNNNNNNNKNNNNKKQAVNNNITEQRTQRLISFNAPQQSRMFRF